MRLAVFIIVSLTSTACLANKEQLNREIIDHCNQLTQYAAQGATWYQNKQYKKALEAFQDQAAWTSFCTYQEDITGKNINKKQLATAYNNVGLTYAKLEQPRWARAWFELFPDFSFSQFNLKQLPPVTAQTNRSGTYVRYAGQGAWNTLEITKHKDHYQINFFGLRMGLMAMIYGPNMGEFRVDMPQTATTVKYHYEDCVIQLDFLAATAHGERIKVTQTDDNNSSCGFGFGVYADGTYLKVED